MKNIGQSMIGSEKPDAGYFSLNFVVIMLGSFKQN